MTEVASRSGSEKLTHKDIRYVNREVVEEYEEESLRRLIENRCKNVVFTLFGKTQKRI